MSTTEHVPTDTPAGLPLDLAAWDWQAELKRQERSIPWLARRTQRSQHSVYQYAGGHRPAPQEWLEMAAVALGIARP